ncbi:MAG: T9SS type A sorting domain-containing protein, partial [Ignavibacteriales bacterium]|nr:T9SS type A sorting domain-containing protein [Ignavibacteriales bacterium]
SILDASDATFVIAQPKTWTGATGSDWFNSMNWTPTGAPTPTDAVIVPPTLNDPLIDQTAELVAVAEATIQSQAALSISDKLGAFETNGDVRIFGTLEVLAGATTDILLGGMWVDQPVAAGDAGFAPGASEVIVKDSSALAGGFYDLTLDSSAVALSTGNVEVANKLRIPHGVFALNLLDTLLVENDDSAAIEGAGLVLAGTIVRAIADGSTAAYRFESDFTFIRFDSGGATPDYLALSTLPGVDPDSLKGDMEWVEVEAEHDDDNKTMTVHGLTEIGAWTFGFEDDGMGKADAIAAGRMMRRVYRGRSGRNEPTPKQSGANSDATFSLTLRYDVGEIPFADSIDVDFSDLKLYRLEDPVELEETREAIPERFTLDNAYPNPFNPSTTIRYVLPEPAAVVVTVYDALGRRVAVLMNERQDAGKREVVFRAENLPSGAYFMELRARSESGVEVFHDTKKALLLK